MKKGKCPLCGRKGRRECPALNAVICSECCGTKRISAIPCSSECPHNVFGLHAIEAFRAMDNDFHGDVLLPAMLKKGFLSPEEATKVRADISEENFFVVKMYILKMTRLFRDRQPDGRTAFEVWQADGFEGLTHDEACMLGFKKNTMPTVIELQKNIDNNFVECIDIFDPERGKFMLLDPMLASAQYPRYLKALCWLENYPAFSRISGGLIVPALIAREFIEMVKEMAMEKLFAAAEFPEKECLRTNFDYFWKLPEKMHDEKRKAMLSSIDIKICNALYDIGSNYQQILDILGSKPDFEERPEEARQEGERYFLWKRCGESKKIEEKMPEVFRHEEDGEQFGIVGNLILRKDSLLIEARKKQMFTFAMKMARHFFGDLITLRKKAERDLAKEMAAKDFKPALREEKSENKIPAEIKEKILHDYMEKHYRKFIDAGNTRLYGMTPRQASRKPEMRATLLDLMKEHIHMNETNARQEGISPISLDWLLDELNLGELKQ